MAADEIEMELYWPQLVVVVVSSIPLQWTMAQQLAARVVQAAAKPCVLAPPTISLHFLRLRASSLSLEQSGRHLLASSYPVASVWQPSFELLAQISVLLIVSGANKCQLVCCQTTTQFCHIRLSLRCNDAGSSH